MFSKTFSIYRSIIKVCVIIVWLFLLSFNKAYAQSAAVRVMNTADGGKVDMAVRNRSNDELAAGGLITWSDVKAGKTNWKVADQYIEITHKDLPVSWGMQIYTDNQNASANPRYTGTANPAGLIKTNNTLMALPMAWRISDKVLKPYDSKDPDNPNNLDAVEERSDHKGMESYLWHFLKDKNTPDNPATTDGDESFVNGEEYVTLWNQAGLAWNEGGRSGNPKKARIYLAAKFTTASVNSEYKTSTLTVELFDGALPFPLYLYKDAPLTEFPNEKGATLENHFAPSGWFNYGPTRRIITVNSRSKEVEPHSGEHCLKIHWNGNSGTDGYKWGGVMWLEPEDIWAEMSGVPKNEWQAKLDSLPENGYDLRGVDRLSFWARTDNNNVGLQIMVYFGNKWDTCGQIPPAWRSPVLTTTWQEYIIPTLYHDMSNVTGGFAVIFNDEHDPNPDGCTIYLDDIKFDKL